MICRTLYNSRTGVWFIICENFNEIECCTKLSIEVGVWDRREELILWCSGKMENIVVFIGKCAILEELDIKRICVLELIL